MVRCNIDLYLRTLKLFGLLCATYNPKKNLLYITERDKFYAFIVFILTQSLTLYELLYCILNPEKFFLSEYTVTGNIYIVINFTFDCIMLSIVNIYFYMNRIEVFAVVKEILYLNNLPENEGFEKSYAKWYMIYACSGLTTGIIHMMGFFRSKNLLMWVKINYIILHTYAYFSVGFVMIFYVILESILKQALNYYNKQLQDRFQDFNNYKNLSKSIRCILLKRQDLLDFCHNRVNILYGRVLLPIGIYIVFLAPSGPFFFISVTLSGNITGIPEILASTIVSVLWNIPWIVAFSMMLLVNGVTKEALRSKKILLKFYIKNKEIENMVEKVLLKAIRSKSILTAYDFFDLERSTLFALFTAIITFMVILVQFKEIEMDFQHNN